MKAPASRGRYLCYNAAVNALMAVIYVVANMRAHALIFGGGAVLSLALCRYLGRRGR